MMDTFLKVAVAFVCVWLILAFLVPLLSGLLATVVTVLVVLCSIVYLLKVSGLWF